jgi:GR25 family glycosyltransferase involved in LPS biosynthesis
MSTLKNHVPKIEKFYIITVKQSRTSVTMANKLLESCKMHNMSTQIWEAVDGLGDQIVLPDHLINQVSMQLVKQRSSNMTNAEVACFLSHYSLWCHCVSIDRPICIFEHDAVLLKEIKYHPVQTAIQFLGCKSQLDNIQSNTKTIKGIGYYFMKGAHAYTIDPSIAKNMIAYVIKEGIIKPLDIMLRSDMFTIYQDDIYAHETDEITEGVLLSSVSSIIGKRQSFEEPKLDYS